MFLRILYLLPAVLLAFALGQAPEFAQQYRQRLGGALDELQTLVTRFRADAVRQGLDVAAALTRLDANTDPLARDRGADMRIVIARRDRLARQLAAFETGGAFTRLAELAVDFDADLTARTLRAYQPALPVTFEGVAAAGLGALAGLGFAEAARLGLARRARRRAG